MRIKVYRDRCSGCRLCQQVCAIRHFGEINPKKAALRIEAKFPNPGKYRPVVCSQCGKCAAVCRENAITQNESGAYIVDKDKCTLCGECVTACPLKVVFRHPDCSHVIICDFCLECTRVCNTDALAAAGQKEETND